MTTSIIEPAKSSRSKCGGCKKQLEKGELRFGIYNDQWESYKWHHLVCAAAIDKDDFLEAVEEFEGEIPDVEGMLEAAKNIGKGTKTPRVEEATSNRSSCFVCEEKIEPKGTLRGVLFREIETDVWRKGFTHVKCMAETTDMDRDDLIDLLIENSVLTEEQVETVVSEI